jgi:hypothetical protein
MNYQVQPDVAKRNSTQVSPLPTPRSSFLSDGVLNKSGDVCSCKVVIRLAGAPNDYPKG